LFTIAQTYNDGPINLQVKVRDVNVTFNATDEALLGIGFAPDELSFKFWARDNVGGGWQGGQCLTDDFSPPTQSTDFNSILLNNNYPGGAPVPGIFDVRIDAWEDDIPSDGLAGFCTGGTRCDWNGSTCCGVFVFGVCVGLTESDDNRCDADPFITGVNYRLGPPCQWYDHGYMAGTGCSDNFYQPRIESYWRYTAGTSCNNAIDLGPVNSGVFLSHFNSNECYSNNFPTSPGNDVFYQIDVQQPIGLTISLCAAASFDTDLYLLDASCTQIEFDDNFCASTSEITTAICTPGIYYIVVDADAAAQQGTFTLTIQDEPSVLLNVDAGPDQIVCIGDSATLGGIPSASNGITPYVYAWSPAIGLSSTTVANPNAAPPANQQYILSVTDGNGCTRTDTVDVDVFPAFTATISSTTTQICADDSVTLTSTGGVAYQWLLNNGTIFNANDSVYYATQSGDYAAVVTNNVGCVDTTPAITVSVLTSATAFIATTDPTTICAGDSVEFVGATLGNTYQWLQNGTAVVNATDSLFTTYTAGSYQVATSFNGNCPDTSNSIVVTVNPNPPANIVPSVNQSVCFGDSVQLQASGGNTYEWFYNGTSTGITTSSIFASQTGDYYAEVTTAAGCTELTTTVNVTVDPLPIPTIVTSGPTSFCQGDSLLLIGTGGSVYEWFLNGSALGVISPSYHSSQSGSYTIVASNAAGCTDTSAALFITVNPNPTASITAAGGTTACDGNAVTLQGNGTGDYEWFQDGVTTGATTPTYDATVSGNYTLTVTDPVTGCSNTSPPTAVTINSSPNATATVIGSTTLCQGDSIPLSATGGGTYEWLFNGTPLPNSASSIYYAGTAGTYSVVVADPATGCTDTATAQPLTVNPSPTATATILSGTSPTCDGDSIILQSSAGTTYQWFENGSPVFAATNQTYTVTSTGVYAVSVTNTFGCGDTSTTLNLVVEPQPIATITTVGSTSICPGDSTGLVATGGDSYQWLLNGNAIPNATSPVYFALTPGDYSVVASNATGNCTDESAIVTVDLYPQPNANFIVLGANAACEGDSITLQAFGGDSYEWLLDGFPLTATTDPVYQATQGGVYTLVAIGQGGCRDTSLTAITLTFNEIPEAQAFALGDTSFCPGASVTLVASGTGTYQWLENGSPISGETNGAYVATATGSYSVQVTGQGNCAATSDAINVSLYPVPTATTNPDTNLIICPGGGVSIFAGGGGTYDWLYNGSSYGFTNGQVLASSAGDYAVVAINTQGCRDTSATITVSEIPFPVAELMIMGDASVCEGNTVTLLGMGGDTYQWVVADTLIDGATSSIYEVTQTGEYSLIASNACGSDTTSTITAQVNQNPSAGIVHEPLEIFIEEPVQFIDQSISAATWSWDFGDGGTSTLQNPTYVYDTEGTYTVTLTVMDDIGCVGTNTILVNAMEYGEIFFPNVFSPNGDGLYDQFEPYYSDLQSLELQIFNRWGKEVFFTNNPNVHWDGTINGKQAHEGVYYYMLVGRNKEGVRQLRKGHLTLVR